MARRKKQQDLGPEFARVERPEIEEPAEDLRAITGEIATLNERKRNAQRTLVEKMESAGITVHKYLDPEGQERKVVITSTPKAKIERVKGAKPDDDAKPSDDDVEVH